MVPRRIVPLPSSWLILIGSMDGDGSTGSGSQPGTTFGLFVIVPVHWKPARPARVVWLVGVRKPRPQRKFVVPSPMQAVHALGSAKSKLFSCPRTMLVNSFWPQKALEMFSFVLLQ